MKVRENIGLTKNVRAMRRIFRRLVRVHYPRGTELVRVHIHEVGSYAFKHALRYELTLRTPERKLVRVLVRGNVPSEDARREIRVADRVQRALGRHAFSFGLFRVAVSFGVIPQLRLNLYEDYPGSTLESLAQRGDGRSVRVARLAGMWAAALHKSRLLVAPRRSMRRVTDEARFFRDDVGRNDPRSSSRMIRVLHAAVRAQEDIVERHRGFFTTIHGDMNLGNVVSGRDGSLGFIDFGASWVFDPLSDVGNFLAQVDLLILRGRVRRALALKIIRAFLSGYKSTRGRLGPNVNERIDLHHAWWILQIIAYTVSTKRAVGQQLSPRLFPIAERLLAARGYPPLPRFSSGIPSKGLKRALLDEGIMLAYFAEHLRGLSPEAQKVESLKVSSHHAFSRQSFLTRYTLSVRLPTGEILKRVIRGNALDDATLEILSSVFRNRSRRFESPRPLRYERKLGYAFYEEVTGRSLRTIDVRSKSFARLVTKSADALDNLHRLSSSGLRRLAWSAEGQRLSTVERRLQARDVQARSFSIPALDILRSTLRRVWTADPRLVHNDYQASNILVAGKRVGMIDYTQSGVGHPSLDVANFLAHLSVMLAGIVRRSRIEDLRLRFLRAYLSRATPQRRTVVLRDLPVFELRSALDILATTLLNLGPRDPNRRRYVSLLHSNIKKLIVRITRV